MRFDCEYQDVWTEAYYDTKLNRHKLVKTGDNHMDCVLRSVQFKGYILHDSIAQGKFGCVFLACNTHHPNKIFVAMKFKKASRGKSSGALPLPLVDIPDEFRIHQQLCHPNVVEFYEYFNIKDQFCAVLEYCDNGNLESLLQMRNGGFIVEQVAKRYFQDMFLAVEYLHQQCIVHCHIKCANFVVDKANHIKICDFGAAREFRAGDPLIHCVTGEPGYQCPEILLRTMYNPRQADLWALGVVLYIMVTSKLPLGPIIEKEEMLETLAQNEGVLAFPANSQLLLSDDLKQLIHGVCNSQPENRYGHSLIQNSPWMKATNTKVYIGNQHMTRVPQKVAIGNEHDLKRDLQV